MRQLTAAQSLPVSGLDLPPVRVPVLAVVVVVESYIESDRLALTGCLDADDVCLPQVEIGRVSCVRDAPTGVGIA
jgi:hypothetical protein